MDKRRRKYQEVNKLRDYEFKEIKRNGKKDGVKIIYSKQKMK